MADLPPDCTTLRVGEELHYLPQFHRVVVRDDAAVEPLRTLLRAIVYHEVVVHVAVQVLV